MIRSYKLECFPYQTLVTYGRKKFYNIKPKGLYYTTFYSRKLWILVEI